MYVTTGCCFFQGGFFAASTKIWLCKIWREFCSATSFLTHTNAGQSSMVQAKEWNVIPFVSSHLILILQAAINSCQWSQALTLISDLKVWLILFCICIALSCICLSNFQAQKPHSNLLKEMFVKVKKELDKQEAISTTWSACFWVTVMWWRILN